ncbi:MAG: hypothetical protein D6696_10745 [Acidobacteria bacterium]|nr:MAG: hypothetical protein D6696_10745 [Acidobacteriota bacterium]
MYKRRTVRCEIHGLHYDPQLTKGCIRCRKEGLADPPAKPQFLPLLLILLGLTIVGAGFVDQLFDRSAADVGAAAAENGGGRLVTLLDPQLFRPQIEALEAALNGDVADFTLLRDRVTTAATALGRAVRPADPRAAEEIFAFAREVANSELDLTHLASARQRWGTLRHRLFLPAAWLEVLGPVDRTAVALDRDLSLSLIDLVNEVQAAGADGWAERAPEWLARLDALRTRLAPPPPFDSDPRLLLARRQLEDGFAELRAAILEGRSRALRPRLEALAASLEESRRAFEDLLG